MSTCAHLSPCLRLLSSASYAQNYVGPPKRFLPRCGTASSAEAWKRWPCSTRSSSAGLFSALRVGMVATLAAQPSPADAASYRSTDRPPAHRCVWVCLNGDVTPRAAQTAPLGPCLSSSHPCTPIADCESRLSLVESKAFELGALQRDPTDAAQEASRVNDEHSEACFRHRHR